MQKITKLFLRKFMETVYKQFLKVNHIRQVDLARFLGVTESSISSVINGRNQLSEPNLVKILNNDRGWDVSMLQPASVGSNINSVVNSKNFSYEHGGISASQFMAYAQENQRQMGQLIDTIAELTKKIQ